MKAFNLGFLSLGFAMAITYGSCILGEYALGGDAKYIVVPLGLLLGMNARRIMQKVLGYTLEEALKEESNEKP